MLELVADNEKAASLADSYTAANRSYYVKGVLLRATISNIRFSCNGWSA